MTAINNSAAVARARQLLHTAADASKQLEESVRELVTMRAWDVLGYKDFSEMWERENGFAAPTHVQVLAMASIRDEGMNTRVGMGFKANGPDGHTQADVADMIGLPVFTNEHGSRYPGGVVRRVFQQLDAGVPPDKVVKGTDSKTVARAIQTHGDGLPQHMRRRPQPRRMGAAPDELVPESFSLFRAEADEIADIARNADVPKAEIYRQAVAEYLMRRRESRPGVAS